MCLSCFTFKSAGSTPKYTGKIDKQKQNKEFSVPIQLDVVLVADSTMRAGLLLRCQIDDSSRRLSAAQLVPLSRANTSLPLSTPLRSADFSAFSQDNTEPPSIPLVTRSGVAFSTGASAAAFETHWSRMSSLSLSSAPAMSWQSSQIQPSGNAAETKPGIYDKSLYQPDRKGQAKSGHLDAPVSNRYR